MTNISIQEAIDTALAATGYIATNVVVREANVHRYRGAVGQVHVTEATHADSLALFMNGLDGIRAQAHDKLVMVWDDGLTS